MECFLRRKCPTGFFQLQEKHHYQVIFSEIIEKRPKVALRGRFLIDSEIIKALVQDIFQECSAFEMNDDNFAKDADKDNLDKFE